MVSWERRTTAANRHYTNLLHFCRSGVVHRVGWQINKATTSEQLGFTSIVVIEYCVKAEKVDGGDLKEKFRFVQHNSVHFMLSTEVYQF